MGELSNSAPAAILQPYPTFAVAGPAQGSRTSPAAGVRYVTAAAGPGQGARTVVPGPGQGDRLAVG